MGRAQVLSIDADGDDVMRLETLVERHAGQVRAALRSCGVADGDLDDAAQRVFLTTLRKLSIIPEGSERAFLQAVAAREASHVRRTYRRRRETPDTDLDSELTDSLRPDTLAVRKARATTIGALLGQMNKELRRVLFLVELEGHGLAETAEQLGVPLGTCKSRLRRARADLSLRIDALPDSVRALVRS